jgi:ethanolamine ammonia-lyase small subunit
VALGRTGASQVTHDLLDFQRAHAQARDAVHARLESAGLARSIGSMVDVPVIRLHSSAEDRATYLQRPDLGRRLNETSRAELSQFHCEPGSVAIIVADGLSALAAERHAPPLLSELIPLLDGFTLAPVCVVEQGRVAIGDEIGAMVGASLAVVLIGERPGLSSPDSLGVYITWEPRIGRSDAERNCISNIRASGLSYRLAAFQARAYLMEASERRLTGFGLKLEMQQLAEGAR